MSDETEVSFDTVLESLGLTMASFVTGDKATISAAFEKVFNYLLDVHAKITAKPAVDPEAPKVLPPYETAWAKNTTAKVKAAKLAASFVESIAKVEGDAALMYHLLPALRESVVKYVANEILWQEWQAERALTAGKTPVVGSKSNLADTYKEGKRGLASLYNLVGSNLTIPGSMILADAKGKTPNLPNLTGNYGGNPAGSTAHLHKLAFVIDGKSYDHPKDVVRAIWSGPERVGKSTTDLSQLLDRKAKGINSRKESDPVTFEHNGRKITVTRKDTGTTV